jgi:hypothetical protein
VRDATGHPAPGCHPWHVASNLLRSVAQACHPKRTREGSGRGRRGACGARRPRADRPNPRALAPVARFFTALRSVQNDTVGALRPDGVDPGPAPRAHVAVLYPCAVAQACHPERTREGSGRGCRGPCRARRPRADRPNPRALLLVARFFPALRSVQNDTVGSLRSGWHDPAKGGHGPRIGRACLARLWPCVHHVWSILPRTTGHSTARHAGRESCGLLNSRTLRH